MKSQPPSPPRWLTPACFLVPLGLYTLTAARTIQGGDTGEFALIGMLGGVPHPPGYPLYALLARTMGYLPINPPFFRIALTSALCAAGAVAVLQRICWRLTGSLFASMLTAAAVAVCSILWRLAGVPEVFALHALLVSLAMLCTLRVIQADDDQVLGESLWLGLVLGLGMSNHHTTVFCAPLAVGALLSVAARSGTRKALKGLGLLVSGGLLGLTPYLLLMSWGHLDNLHAWIWGQTTNWSGLLDHFLRREYGTFQLRSGSAAPARAHWLWVFARTAPKQYAYAFFLAGLVGIVSAWRKDRLFTGSLLCSFLLAGIVFPIIMNLPDDALDYEVADRFYLMPLLLFAPLVAVGLMTIRPRVPRLPLAPILGSVLVLSAIGNWHAVNWSADDSIERYLVAIVRNLPHKAIILGQGDTMMPGLAWVNRVMHIRRDVRYVDTHMIASRWNYDRVLREIPDFPQAYISNLQHPGELGIVLSTVAPTYVIPSLAAEVREAVTLEPAGLLWRLEPKPRKVSTEEAKALLDRDMAALGDLPLPVDEWSTTIHEEVAYPWLDLANAYKAEGKTTEADAIWTKLPELLPPEGIDDASPGTSASLAGQHP